MPARDEFTTATKAKLARRAGYLCSHPDCRRLTIGPATGGGIVCIGEAAHMTAAAPGGPRYDLSLSEDERRSESNGIWLCAVHAKQIDSDQAYFTVARLRDWKAKAEDAALYALVTGNFFMPTGLALQGERLGILDSLIGAMLHEFRENSVLLQELSKLVKKLLDTWHECGQVSRRRRVVGELPRSTALPTRPFLLTRREQQCLDLAAKGKRDCKIGELLHISPWTVHAHIESAKRRLGVATRVEAIVKAVARRQIGVDSVQ